MTGNSYRIFGRKLEYHKKRMEEIKWSFVMTHNF